MNNLVLRLVAIAALVVTSGTALADDFFIDPAAVEVASKSGWVFVSGNQIQISVNKQPFLTGVVRRRYYQVELIRDFLRLQVQVALKRKLKLYVEQSSYSNVLSDPAADDSYVFPNGAAFQSLFVVGNYRPEYFPLTGGSIALADDDKIFFTGDDQGVHVILNGGDVLLIKMAKSSAQQNASFLNQVVASKGNDEFLELALKEYDGDTDASKILTRVSKIRLQ